MPPDDSKDARVNGNAKAASNASSSSTSNKFLRLSAFTIPTPIKQLFDKFPLLTYPSNTLPLRAPPSHRPRHILFIFTITTSAAKNGPSHNPGCLKWQTLLKFHGIDFITAPSSNHASPSGALPFLLTSSVYPLSPSNKASSNSASTTTPSAAANTTSQTQVIPSSKLSSWLKAHTSSSRSTRSSQPNSRLTAYTSLLTPIRLAYLHALYLHPSTFASLASPLYIDPCTTNTLVRAALALPLRAAALEQIVLGAGGTGAPLPTVDVEELYRAAEEAFEALETLLGERVWFSGCGGWDEEGGDDEERRGMETKGNETSPQELDAHIFSYTHTILSLFPSQPSSTPAARLLNALSGCPGLVRHRERISRTYYREQFSD